MPPTPLEINTDNQLKDLKANPKKRLTISVQDCKGLYVRITPKGAKTYCVVARPPRMGTEKVKQTWATLGPTDEFESVEDARAVAAKVRKRIKNGDDPFPPPPEPRDRSTYAWAVEDYIKRYQIGQKGNATSDEVKRVLLKEGAEWKNRRVDTITAKEIGQLLDAVRDGDKTTKPRPYLANRFYAYLRTFFNWTAKPAIQYLKSSPMIGIDKPLRKEKTRTRVFNDEELKSLWKSSPELGTYAGPMLRVMMLTGKRKGVLAEMRRNEIEEIKIEVEVKGKITEKRISIWTPPQDQSENKRRHPVPLAQSVMDILEKLTEAEGNEYYFIGRHKKGHLTPGTALQKAIQKASGVTDFYFHAVRHTMETRLAKLRIAPHIRDLLLDHAWQRGAGQGYDHHDYYVEMQEALETWSAALKAIIEDDKDSNVVQFDKAAK